MFYTYSLGLLQYSLSKLRFACFQSHGYIRAT